MVEKGDISYKNTIFNANNTSGIGIKELNDIILNTDSDTNLDGSYNTPQTQWSRDGIRNLQLQIEQYKRKLFYSDRFGKHDLSKVIPSHTLLNFMNGIFGYDGWEMEILSVETTDFVELTKSSTSLNNMSNNKPIESVKQESVKQETLKLEDPSIENGTQFMVMAEASVRIRLKDGTASQSIGIGRGQFKSKGDSFNKARKESITDAMKKTVLNFTNFDI